MNAPQCKSTQNLFRKASPRLEASWRRMVIAWSPLSPHHSCALVCGVALEPRRDCPLWILETLRAPAHDSE